ncbi:hypothetical protein FSPOR_10052 [Fusarium sporotrichioides]|uniref:F-box domain-containing protein n=1 Tax=Fusarium sporotrichioides TaxID=5514 RepID=A0A395RMF2_FUSSP|nr:hypothetical protein FSPOR_10052 [Fusarium sporotrichioides]
MTGFPHNTSGLLKLSNEILLAIFELCRSTEQKQKRPSISNLRLTCRRFGSLCNDYPIRRCASLDFSRPESVELFQQVLRNPEITEGVHEINLRLHFYHPWIAASLDNFISAIRSEWEQRVHIMDESIGNSSTGYITFEELIHQFVHDTKKNHNEPVYSTKCSNGCIFQKATCPEIIFYRAYNIYREKHNSQMLWYGNGAFAIKVAGILKNLPNLRHIMLHDGVLENNYDLGRKFDPVGKQDTSAQADILIQVFSRPMLWEEARWIQPNEYVWPGVPIRLLIEIPVALGAVDSFVFDHLSIHVSAAPDYMAMQLSKDDEEKLSEAIKNFDLMQFNFQPRCRSGCGPWITDRGENITIRTASEMDVVNQYLGSFFHAGCIMHADINLGEFWYSLGLESVLAAPTSIGIGFTWPLDSSFSSIHLTEISVTTRELGAMTEVLGRESQLSLFLVHIRTGLWREALQRLRQGLHNPQSVRIMHPLGGEIPNLTDNQIVSVFNVEHIEGFTKAESYVMGILSEDAFNGI